MLWIFEMLWPFTLPLVIILFILITEESIKRKFNTILLPLVFVIIEIFFDNIYITIISQLALIMVLIGILIYYYNKRII